MTRVVVVAFGAVALAAYAAVRIHQGAGVAASVVGAALGIVVLVLLARGRAGRPFGRR